MKLNRICWTLLTALLMCTQALGTSVNWIDGNTPPAGWIISPNSPSPVDNITFSGPLNFVYPNSCWAQVILGGSPQISVDTFTQEVELWFQGPPPGLCTAIFDPVCGLQGDFGPLAAGNWTFKCTEPAIAFNIPFTVTPVSNNTYYVDKDAPGPYFGSNWIWAFKYLQDALDVAGPGDTILVAEGVYMPDEGASPTPGDRSATFNIQDGVTVIGGYAGYGNFNPDARDIDTYTTVLSGDLNSNDLWGILNRDDNSYHVVTASGPGALGAVVDGVTITAGQADGPDPGNSGGGVQCNNAILTLIRTTLYENTGALGGGLASHYGTLSLVNCVVIGNDAYVYGGGLYIYEGDASLVNCMVAGNSGFQADYTGGSAIYNLAGNLTIYDCTIADNVGANGRAITSYAWGFPATNQIVVYNSILYNGGNEIFTNHGVTNTVSYSDVQGGWTGNGSGNIDADPLFNSPGLFSVEGQWIHGDYRLQNGSPCIDQGSSSLLPQDTTDLDGDTNTAEALPWDLDDTDRVQGVQLDMGCYEQVGVILPPPPPPPGCTLPSPPSPGVGWTQVVALDIQFTPVGPFSSVDVSGSYDTYVQTNFASQFALTIYATSCALGDWNAYFDPDPGVIFSPGDNVHIEITGENLDASEIYPGIDVNVAKLVIWVRPAI